MTPEEWAKRMMRERDQLMRELISMDRGRTQERRDKAHAIREKLYQERQAMLKVEEETLGRGSWS